MKEIKAIIDAYNLALKEEIRTILATVVHVDGSSYRRPSARMLIDEFGNMTGAISGGCLEGDAKRKALLALEKDQNMLVTYDTSDEEDAIVGAQLGCEGVIQVLFEPIRQQANNPIELLEKASATRIPGVLVVHFDLKNKNEHQVGTTLLLEGSTQSGTVSNSKLLNQILKDSQSVLEAKASLFRAYLEGDKQHNVFLEYHAPPVSLVIVGAGNDTQVLAQLGDLIGWKVTVVDGRPTHAKAERFISSCQVIVSKPEQLLEQITIDHQTVFVLITHNYNYDLKVLGHLVNYDSIPYIGILGPKKKFNRMLDDLKAEGITLSETQMEKIFAPVGLEIGAETSEEIALSIISEIKAVLSGKRGTPLREKTSPIHTKSNSQFDTVRIE